MGGGCVLYLERPRTNAIACIDRCQVLRVVFVTYMRLASVAFTLCSDAQFVWTTKGHGIVVATITAKDECLERVVDDADSKFRHIGGGTLCVLGMFQRASKQRGEPAGKRVSERSSERPSMQAS